MNKKDKSKALIHVYENKSEMQMSRKEAIKKTGYLALSAATMMLLLNSPAKALSSPASPPSGF